jgi:hypothetical protein
VVFKVQIEIKQEDFCTRGKEEKKTQARMSHSTSSVSATTLHCVAYVYADFVLDWKP